MNNESINILASVFDSNKLMDLFGEFEAKSGHAKGMENSFLSGSECAEIFE